MKTIIIEDEALNAQGLQKLLQKTKPDVEVIAVLDSVQSSVEWFRQNPQPDLIFVDIQLADGLSFEIFDQIEILVPVIFTTAYDKYALHAFKVNSIDYLLKPINKEDLQRALKKFEKISYSSALTKQQIQMLINSFHHSDKRYKERFLVHDKGGMAPIPADDVAYFIKESLIYLITKDHQRYVTDYNTLDELEDMVHPQKFFRANRQMLLHKDQVMNYKKHYTGKMTVHIKIDPKLEVDVSREKSHEFLNWLEH